MSPEDACHAAAEAVIKTSEARWERMIRRIAHTLAPALRVTREYVLDAFRDGSGALVDSTFQKIEAYEMLGMTASRAELSATMDLAAEFVEDFGEYHDPLPHEWSVWIVEDGRIVDLHKVNMPPQFALTCAAHLAETKGRTCEVGWFDSEGNCTPFIRFEGEPNQEKESQSDV